jgi:hypothetical protein
MYRVLLNALMKIDAATGLPASQGDKRLDLRQGVRRMVLARMPTPPQPDASPPRHDFLAHLPAAINAQ